MQSQEPEPGQGALLPSGLRVYAIGDIHGRADLLDDLLGQIEQDLVEHPCLDARYVFLGDYIDRGPQSRGVLERLQAFSLSHTAVFLKGNHEEMLLAFLRDPPRGLPWIHAGGWRTLASYGIDRTPEQRADLIAIAAELRSALPAKHLAFLKSLALSHGIGGYHFVHAGVRPGTPLALQSSNELLWIRDEFLESTADFGKIIVHGHSPVARVDIRANRINTDTGAWRTGRLSCAVLEHDQRRILATTPAALGSPALGRAFERLRRRFERHGAGLP
jgi:serine/threonine protein phosphatase 1